RTEEGLNDLRRLLQIFPDYEAAWTVKVDLCRQAQHALEEAHARCRLLELTGKEHDPALEERYGLVKRAATGQVIGTPPVALDEQLYVGTTDGWLHEFDLRELAFVHKGEVLSAVVALSSKTQLHIALEDRSKAELKGELPTAARWASNHAGHPGPVVRHKGKYFRPLAGGHVDVLRADNKVETYRTTLKDIERWRIYLGPGGPLGVGTGGV